MGESDISHFPVDKAVLPVRLENMRPGQIRDAIANGAVCLLPIGTIEATVDDTPLGIDRCRYELELETLSQELNAVIAPPVWYSPTGYILSTPAEGTLDVPAHAFAHYLEETLITLGELGFPKIHLVVLHDPQGKDSPLRNTVNFVIGNLFNDLWKDPKIGKGWWARPDLDKINWMRYQVIELPVKEVSEDPSPVENSSSLLRLEHMRPSELTLALKRGLPCFVPVGVLENHGNHNPIGCDAIEAQEPILRAAAEAPCVIAPTVWYGPTGYAVSTQKLGTTNIDGHVFQVYIKGVVEALAGVGFCNVVFVQFHQGGGAQNTAIAMAISEYRSQLHRRGDIGSGWGQKRKGTCDINATNVQLIAPPGMPGDHAGRNETSWMLLYRPEQTRLDLIRPNDYTFCWTPGGEANKASVEWGREMEQTVVEGWRKIIRNLTQPQDE